MGSRLTDGTEVSRFGFASLVSISKAIPSSGKIFGSSISYFSNGEEGTINAAAFPVDVLVNVITVLDP